MSEYLNLEYFNFKKSSDGEDEFPLVAPCTNCFVDEWRSFNYALTDKHPSTHGISFYVDDYQFARVWNSPCKYINVLRKFSAVLMPDFSTYLDFPVIIQKYNKYRNHWLAAFWQSRGINVVPQIEWGAKESFNWCFKGYPQNSIVAVSNVGIMNNQKNKQLFREGYHEMCDRLTPKKILLFGHVYENYEGEIEYIPYSFFRGKRK